jgi:hypothetical protein
MSADAGAAIVRLTASEPAPAAAAGERVTLRLRAACAAGCDRTGMTVTMMAPGEAARALALARHADGISETDEVVLTAPPRVGRHVFRFVLAAHEIAGTSYAEAALEVPLQVHPQATSLAVWDVPSPVNAGARFAVKTGAKSAAGCPLAGRAVEVCDAAGAVVARGTLGATPLADTAALYWTEIALDAPDAAGIVNWSVRFAADGLALPHEDAATAFSTAVAPRPEHRLTVKVVEQATAAPLADVELRLVEGQVGAYRGITGASGLAEIALPKGRYQLSVWKTGYDAPPRPVEIGADAFVEVAASILPEEDPDARWKM